MSQSHGLWECYNTLLLSEDVDRLRNICTRHSLFLRTLEIPGDIVEVGVFRGVSLLFWLKMLTIYCPNSMKRVIGFDTFSGEFGALLPYEEESARTFLAHLRPDAHDGSWEDIPVCLTEHADTLGMHGRLECVVGAVEDTACTYVDTHPGMRVSLLHLDVDTFGGTGSALEAFYPLVSRGGLIVLDEYGKPGWGETDAVDDFLFQLAHDRHPVPTITPIPYAHTPTAVMVKP